MSISNILYDGEQFKLLDTKRIVYAITCVFAFLATEIGRYVYRPYIYEHNINDFGLADSVGNWGGIVVQIFLGLAILNSKRRKAFRLITFFVLGYIIYEFMQPTLPKGTFDWMDVYGTIFGGFVSMLLYVLINKLIKKDKIIYQFN